MTLHSSKLFDIVALAVQLDAELGGEAPPPTTDIAPKKVLRDMRIAAINKGDYVEGQMLTHLYEYMRNKGVSEIERVVDTLLQYLREMREQISIAKIKVRK